MRVSNGSTYLLSDPINPGETWAYTFTEQVELQYYDLTRLWITGFLNVTLIHDVAVTDVSLFKTVVGQGYPTKINVTVQNQGAFTETFNVNAYANTTTIETQTVVSLLSGETRILLFKWNTTAATPKGRYTISAVADTVPGETDTADNTLIEGVITVAMVGDVVPDGTIDIFDIVIVALHFAETDP